MSTVNLHDFFSGSWGYERHVSDHPSVMSGRLSFQKEGELYKATDKGFFLLDGKKHEYYQNQFWELEEGKLSVYKPDKTQLHVFSIPYIVSLPLQLTHTHICACDHYNIEVCFLSSSSWSTRYCISGPKKDQRIDTFFSQ